MSRVGEFFNVRSRHKVLLVKAPINDLLQGFAEAAAKEQLKVNKNVCLVQCQKPRMDACRGCQISSRATTGSSILRLLIGSWSGLRLRIRNGRVWHHQRRQVFDSALFVGAEDTLSGLRGRVP